jgi:hypothetical protein
VKLRMALRFLPLLVPTENDLDFDVDVDVETDASSVDSRICGSLIIKVA